MSNSKPITEDVGSSAARTRRWREGLRTAALALIIAMIFVYAPLQWASSQYRVVFNAIKGANCLPYSVFLVQLTNKNVSRGDYVAFVAQQMEPFYKNGTLAVKLLAGVPGDTISVSESGVWVGGTRWGDLLHAKQDGRLWRMGRHVSDYLRHEQVPTHRYWMMGTHPRSYDSRYWGYITDEQVVGRAIPLW